MEPPKEYGKIVVELQNCLIDEEYLADTPSRKHGVSEELERDLRVVGCMYIQSAGLLLRLPQVAMATAQVLFQRFYYSKSFINYSVQYMAAATLFVAAKVEEAPRRLRDVINVFHHLRQKRTGRSIQPMDYMGNTYFKVKSEIIRCERYLLKAVGLCVHVQHPHKMIITFLQVLEMEKNSELVQKAWNYMNDSLRTNVFVRFAPEKIACACIFLATRQFKIPLPNNPPWWKLFEITREELEIISLEILQLYTYPIKTLEEVEKEVAVIKDELAKRKQVDIKEVQLSNSSGALSSQNSSPLIKTAALLPLPDHKHLLNSDSKNSPDLLKLVHTNKIGQSADRMINHSSPKKTTRKRLHSSSEDRPYQKKSGSVSPPSGRSHSTSRDRSDHSGSADYKPIRSPIKLSHSSSEEHSSPADAHLPRKYQDKYDNHKYDDHEKPKKRRRSRHDRQHRRREKHHHRHRHSRERPEIRGHIKNARDIIEKRRHEESRHRRSKRAYS